VLKYITAIKQASRWERKIGVVLEEKGSHRFGRWVNIPTPKGGTRGNPENFLLPNMHLVKRWMKVVALGREPCHSPKDLGGLAPVAEKGVQNNEQLINKFDTREAAQGGEQEALSVLGYQLEENACSLLTTMAKFFVVSSNTPQIQ